MGRRFFLLDSKENGLKFGVHLETSEFGIVGIVNFHFPLEDEYEILLTDKMGLNFYAKMQENPFSFSLPKEFVVDDNLKIDIFKKGTLVGSYLKNDVRDKLLPDSEYNVCVSDDIFKEAEYFIEKAKKLFGETKNEEIKLESYFFDTIKEDFDLLYSIGEIDYSLSKKFKNSNWRKIVIGSEVYLLGKIYAKADEQKKLEPNFVAIALSTTRENARANLPLGINAKFFNANIYDSFGYLVLVENTRTGVAVNL